MLYALYLYYIFHSLCFTLYSIFYTLLIHHLSQTQLIRYRRQRAGSGSLCRVVFALGQAKFCVFANFIRIARLFWHFSQGNWLLSLFSCVVFKRMQKNVKLARGLWLLNVPVLINFPCGNVKENISFTQASWISGF